ncbi:hypothetical protein SNE40_004380 [Patella caerulea]|uniref:BHLH domain-containing protein n=1 Tax=Patella caerulea TaxID=87958 RepID=A0AAN8K972_PATCE
MFPQNYSVSSHIVRGLSHRQHDHPDRRDIMMTCDTSSRKRCRPISNAARERSRVKTLRSAFLDLQETLPSVPPDTKLSKLDVLILATTYITHLMKTLDSASSNGDNNEASSVPIFHPVKKWPMRTRLYDGILDSTKPVVGSKRKKGGRMFDKPPIFPANSDVETLMTSNRGGFELDMS